MPNRILVDVAPLRDSRQFRLLFAGQLITTLGSQLTVVAIPFQVYALTRSSLQVGAVSLAQLVPLIIGALVGGSIGDAMDRRTILVVTSLALSLTSGALAVNALLGHPAVWAIYVVSAVAAALTGVISTARNAVIPSLIQPTQLVAAYSFVQAVFQLGTVVGPALSGLLIDVVHLQWVYAIDGLTYVLSVVAALAMAPIPPAEGATRPGLHSFFEGLRFVRRRQLLQGAYLIDINAMVFGMPRALFPALASSVFHGGATTLGWLYTAPGAGALIGAIATGWLERIRRQAWAVIVAVCVWGAAIVGFGLVHVLWAALLLLAVAGWADVISAVLRNTILQASVPEGFRSRISALQMAVVQGGPRLGDLEAGVVATAISNEFSIVSGGLACIAGAVLLGLALPRFRHYRAGETAEDPDPDRDVPGGAGPEIADAPA